MPEFLIRPLRNSDIPAVAALLEQLALKFILPPLSAAAATRFLAANNAKAIGDFIAAGFVYHVAYHEGQLVGFAGVRDHAHLYHLFVAEQVHGRGLGRRLWDVARQACYAAGNPGRFTVNAANNAIGVYETFGFRRTEPMQEREGMQYNPMELIEQR